MFHGKTFDLLHVTSSALPFEERKKRNVFMGLCVAFVSFGTQVFEHDDNHL